MKKDIYIIRNRVNNKVYIGQSKNVAQRFISHCKKSGSLISEAIRSIGANNFWFEIIEKQVDDPDERERYWISFYNSITPNGYNIQDGGSDPPHYYSIEHPSSNFNNIEEVDEIKKALRDTELSLAEIGRMFNVSKRTIMRINQGIHYEKLGETYPIRKVPLMNGKITDEQAAEIIEILQYSYRQYEDIGLQYGVTQKAIKDINVGKTHHIDGVDYPIRKYKNSGKPLFTYEQVTEISELLLHTDISFRQIAKCYDASLNSIYQINNGTAKRYRREEYAYPLRKHNKYA